MFSEKVLPWPCLGLVNTHALFLEHCVPVTASTLTEISFSPATWVPRLVCLVDAKHKALLAVWSVLLLHMCQTLDWEVWRGTGSGAGAWTTLKDSCRREVTMERVWGRNGTVWRAANESVIRRSLRREIQGQLM